MANGIVIGSGSGTQKPALLVFKPNPSVKKAKKKTKNLRKTNFFASRSEPDFCYPNPSLLLLLFGNSDVGIAMHLVKYHQIFKKV